MSSSSYSPLVAISLGRCFSTLFLLHPLQVTPCHESQSREEMCVMTASSYTRTQVHGRKHVPAYRKNTSSLSHSISPLKTALFFGETRTPPLRPQMTSSLHTRDRDPPNLFTARNDTHSSVESPATAHLCRTYTAQTLCFQAFRHTGRAARGHSTVAVAVAPPAVAVVG